jgi:2-desacetyl-2-hydroxyethyl bacteriochlorophyllide A dehydrogenase
MKTVICQKPGELIAVEQKQPKQAPGEALIRMQRLGICGTDLHAFGGRQPFFSYPRVLGHELAGEIIQIGENTYDLHPGEMVAVIPYLECGICIACQNGKPNCCTDLNVLGVHSDGGMSEYISVPSEHILKNAKLTADQLAITECFAIGAHAVRRAGKINGEKVLVAGAGPIGMGIMQCARIAGGLVIALDISADRLAFVKEHLAVEHTVQAGSLNVRDRLAELTDGDFPSVIFDATGNRQSMMENFLYLAHGGRYVLVGLVTADICFPDPEFHKRETTLLSSRNALREDFQWVMECMEHNLLKAEPMITHRSTFSQIIGNFHYWTTPAAKVIKAMVEF